jgi:hypothetical protein
VLSTTTRTNNPTWFDSVTVGNSYESDMKEALRVGGPETLNVYTVGLTGSNSLGFGSYPSMYVGEPTIDGVVILHSSVPGGSKWTFGYDFSALTQCLQAKIDITRERLSLMKWAIGYVLCSPTNINPFFDEYALAWPVSCFRRWLRRKW